MSADDAKAKHVSQVQEDQWNDITKSCVYLQRHNYVWWYKSFVTQTCRDVKASWRKYVVTWRLCGINMPWFWNLALLLSRTLFQNFKQKTLCVHYLLDYQILERLVVICVVIFFSDLVTLSRPGIKRNKYQHLSLLSSFLFPSSSFFCFFFFSFLLFSSFLFFFSLLLSSSFLLLFLIIRYVNRFPQTEPPLRRIWNIFGALSHDYATTLQNPHILITVRSRGHLLFITPISYFLSHGKRAAFWGCTAVIRSDNERVKNQSNVRPGHWVGREWLETRTSDSGRCY